MTRLKTLLVFLLLFTTNIVNANYLDDWPDDALCGWMQQSSPPEYIADEVKKRGILCTDGIASIDPNASSDQSSNNSGIEIYDIVFSEDVLEELIQIAPQENAADFTKSFKQYQLANLQRQLICGFRLRRVVYENNPEGEIEDWNLAHGSLIINGSKVTLDGRWKTGGLSNDPKYMKDEVNLRLTKDGHIVGKMAYFHLFVNNGEAAEKPLFIELKKHQKSKTINYRSINSYSAAEIWIDVQDWAGGVMTIFNCLDSKEIEKKKLAKDNAEKLYKEALAKEKAELRLLNKIYQPYVLGPNTVFNIKYLDGVFKANSPPEDSKKLHDDELHKAHISGVIESDKLNKNLAINSLASIRESEDFTVLVLITNENEIAPLKDFAKPSIEHCGKLPGWWWDKLSFVISTYDIEIAKKQKCYFDFFNNQTNSEAKSLYRAILSASTSIASYLESNVDR
jgi:hypothetical protein